MSKPDKPIFNQQGGRGKLSGPTHGATYMGTYQMPDGKMDRRMFNSATNKDAIRAYTCLLYTSFLFHRYGTSGKTGDAME